jgi:hypothetical protein
LGTSAVAEPLQPDLGGKASYHSLGVAKNNVGGVIVGGIHQRLNVSPAAGRQLPGEVMRYNHAQATPA